MARKVRILGVQTNPEVGNKVVNLDKVKTLVEENSWFKPDLVVLSEVFNCGVGHEYFHSLAEEIPNGATTEFLSALAKKISTNIVGGSYIEKCPDGKYRNASVIFDRAGNIIGKYHKIHMFSYYGSKEKNYITSGSSCHVINTDIGKIGLSICYDIRFPELYRSLTFAGAEIIVCPAAWPYPRLEHWMTLNKARAIENLVYFVSVNQVGKVTHSRSNLGHSMIISPWGEVIASVGSYEGVMMAEIDLDLINKIRDEFPVLNDRNLDAYK